MITQLNVEILAVGFDDNLDMKTTDRDGKFYVKGTTIEVTDIDPVLWLQCALRLRRIGARVGQIFKQ